MRLWTKVLRVPWRNEPKGILTSALFQVNQSEPMTYFRRKNGWDRVLTTPEYPQRTVFRMESCVNPGGRCRDVESRKKGFWPRCQTTFRNQKLYLFEVSGLAT